LCIFPFLAPLLRIKRALRLLRGLLLCWAVKVLVEHHKIVVLGHIQRQAYGGGDQGAEVGLDLEICHWKISAVSSAAQGRAASAVPAHGPRALGASCRTIVARQERQQLAAGAVVRQLLRAQPLGGQQALQGEKKHG
jgi:hypothetical protein